MSEARKSTDGERLEGAMALAGLNSEQLTRLYVERGDAAQRALPVRALAVRRRIDRILCGDAGWAEPAFVLLVAELLDCDPRWLATGQPSQAAAAAIAALSRAATYRAKRADILRQCCEVLEMTPQPAGPKGICRYCDAAERHMRESESRPGERSPLWVDAQHTVCSACLDAEAGG